MIIDKKLTMTHSGRGELQDDPLMGEEAQVSLRSDQMNRWETHPTGEILALSMGAGDAPN